MNAPQLPTWIEMPEIRFSRLDNALHARLHRLLHQLVATAQASPQAALVHPAVMQQWLQAIVQEEDACREVRASLATQDMLEWQRLRTQLLNHLFGSIRAAATSPFEHTCRAGQQLDLLVRTYSGMLYTSTDRQSSLTDSLLIDLAKAPHLQAAQCLSLSATIDKLADINSHYKALRAQRTAQRATQRIPSAGQARPMADKMCRLALHHIQAVCLLSTDATLQAALQALTQRITQQTAEVMAAFQQGQGQKRAAKLAKQRAAKKQDEGDIDTSAAHEGEEENRKEDLAASPQPSIASRCSPAKW